MDEDSTPVKTTKKSKVKLFKNKKMIAYAVVLIVVIAAVGTSVIYYNKYQDSQNKLKHPEVAAKSETQAVVDKVGQLAVLPSGEDPTLATVSDVSKLSGQAFFANAQNGDKVLIYIKAKKAYLYRPSSNKIINVAPLNISDNNAGTTPEPAATTNNSSTTTTKTTR